MSLTREERPHYLHERRELTEWLGSVVQIQDSKVRKAYR